MRFLGLGTPYVAGIPENTGTKLKATRIATELRRSLVVIEFKLHTNNAGNSLMKLSFEVELAH
jgi:hypothetical protein